jgi:hypothetical protein
VAAALVGVVAVVGIVGGLLGFWTLRTAADSDRFEERVESLLQQEEVSDALARRTVNEIAAALDLRASVLEITPEPIVPVADMLLAGVRSRVELRVGELIRSPEVSESIAAAAGRAHEEAVSVLQGDAVVEGVRVDGDEVRINLLPLMSRSLRAIQEIGLLRDADIPELDRGGDPAEQRVALALALDRDLPADFGEPVVFRDEAIAESGTTLDLVRDLLVTARRAFWVLLLVGTGLAALSIWLSQQRWRTAAFLVAGLFAAVLAVRLVVNAARDRAPELVEQPGAKTTVRELADDLAASLNTTLTWYAVVSLAVLLVAAWAVFGVPEWRRGT